MLNTNLFHIFFVSVVLLMFFVFTNKNKPDYLLGVEPDDDVRDNVIYYDEEGAGEW